MTQQRDPGVQKYRFYINTQPFRMVDTWICYLLRTLENMGLMEKTAVLFTSDHGFLFGEQCGSRNPARLRG